MARDEHNDRTVIERVDPLVGSVLDRRYRIDFRLASGGFGAIYRATHVQTGHQVALKVLHTQLVATDDRVIDRFRREGETLLKLQNVHTITAYELGEAPDGPLYIVMELLHGESLFEQYRAKGPLPWRRMVRIALQVCASLSEAHALGVVHRDLKPANINLEKRDGTPDFVKVLDFGIAKIMRDSSLDSTELTQAGQMIGTFDYMAPEQMVGGECTARTDIYTLGVVIYEMIAGRRPFADAASPTAMLASLLTLTASPLSAFADDVPPELDRVLEKCLEREPQNRYQDVDTLSHDLEELLSPSAGETRRGADVEDVTRMIKTPAPVVTDEVTVIASPGARARPGTVPPHPNVIAREGSAPNPIARTRRPTPGHTPSPHIVRRDPTPLPVKSAPNANVIRRPTPPVGNTIVAAGSVPPFQAAALAPPAPPPTPPNPQPSPPPNPPLAPVVNPSDPRPFAPQAPYPTYDPNAAWGQGAPPPVRTTYDMAAAAQRELVVRRIVWAIAIVLGLVLAIVIASRM